MGGGRRCDGTRAAQTCLPSDLSAMMEKICRDDRNFGRPYDGAAASALLLFALTEARPSVGTGSGPLLFLPSRRRLGHDELPPP